MKDKGLHLYWDKKELEGEDRSRALYWLGYGLVLGVPLGMGAGLVLCVVWNLIIFGW